MAAEAGTDQGCDSLCYLLLSGDNRASYCGTTNHMPRRLRQHNQELKGGAKYTSTKRPGKKGGCKWRVLCTVRGFTSRSQTLSFEWLLKRCAGGRGRPLDRRYQQLGAVLHRPNWWKNHPPRPAHLVIEWMDEYHALRNDLLADLPFSVDQIVAPSTQTDEK